MKQQDERSSKSVSAPAKPPRAPRWALDEGTWEGAEALIGAPFHSTTGADPVNVIDIRRRLEVLAWDCPIHYDRDAAREAGHPDIVAPDTMVLTWCLPAYWTPGDRRPEAGDPLLMPAYPYPQVPAPGEAMFATACKLTFHASAYPGDVISSRSALTSVVRKKLKVGDGAFLVVSTQYTKSTGELVAEEEMTLFRYVPSTDG